MMNKIKTIAAAAIALGAGMMFLVAAAPGGLWSGPQPIDAGTGYDAEAPAVAGTDDGLAFAVFLQGDGSYDRVYANRWDGSDWTGATRIDAGWDHNADEPRIAVEGAGQGLALFSQSDGINVRIYANRWDGAAWSGATAIDAATGNDPRNPQAAWMDNGSAVAVFSQVDIANERVYANRWNGHAWSSATTIDAGPTNAFNPRVAGSGAEAMAVFYQHDGANYRVYANRLFGSSWTGATTIDAGPGNDARYPSVAWDGAGGAIAVFIQENGGEDRVYANRWDGSTWSGANLIDAGPGNDHYAPRVAGDGRGNAVAVFTLDDGIVNRAYANRWDGSAWSGAEEIGLGDDGGSQDLEVSCSSSGAAMAVFQSLWRIYAVFWNGAAWGEPVRVDTGTGSEEDGVAADDRGNAIAVFDQEVGGVARIYSNRWRSGPPPLDYDGDGTSDIAVFRPAAGLWAVRGITRVYFGSSADLAVPGDYDGDGTTEPAVFRPAAGLWAARLVTRLYFGSSSDSPLPRDYNSDGTADPAIFRASSGLWAVRGITRAYYGSSADTPVPGYYSEFRARPAVFRPASGLWAVRGVTRVYFGSSGDATVPGDYSGAGWWRPAIFRPDRGLWAIRWGSRVYYGNSTDVTVPGDYAGDGTDRVAIFRPAAGLWAVRGITRVYYGRSGDLPAAR
jgi:hypothetical protein